MGKILLIITLTIDLFVAINSILKRNITALYTIFAIMWSMILIFYLLASGNWFSIDPYIAFTILMGDITFLSTTYIVSNSKPRYSSTNTKTECTTDDKCTTDDPKYYLILVLSIITIIWLSIGLVDRITMLLRGMSFNEIYFYYLRNSSDTARGPIVSLVTMLIARPYCYCSLCVLTNEIYKEGKRKKWVIVLQLLILTFSVIQNGKRAMIIYWFFMMLFEGIRLGNFRKSRSLIQKHKLLFVIAGAIVLGILLWISGRRDTDLFNSVYGYFAGGIPSFSERAPSVTEHFYGLGLLHGLLVPIIITLHGFFHLPYPNWYLQLDKYVEAADYIQIGPDSITNAFNTLYYVPYLDGGLLFVLFEMILVGIIYGIAYRKLKTNDNYRNRSLYELLIVGIVGSGYTLYFTQYPFLIAFFYILIITHNDSHHASLIVKVRW